MPKIVTQDLQDAQAKKQQKFWKRFYLSRRNWISELNKYGYGVLVEIVPDSNTKLLMHLNEDEWDGTEDEVIDSSGTGNDGAAVGDADTVVGGIFNRCGTFDGTGDYVVFPSTDGSLDFGSNSFTLLAWFKTTVGGVKTILSHNSAEVNAKRVFITMNTDLGNGDYGIYCLLQVSGANYKALEGTSKVNDGEWHNVAIVRDVVNNKCQLYVDGVKEDEDVNPVGILTNTNDWSIGSIYYADAWRDYFNGQVDEVAMFNKSLTSEEIKQIFIQEESLDITDWVINCGSLNWQLDTVELNVWKDSNVTIKVKNKKDEWNMSDKDGMFYDKQIKDSKIQIKVGNILSDGSEDLIYTYTGIIKEIKRNPFDQTAIIYLLGYSDILSRYSAEELSDNQITGETLGTGDGAEVDFYTDEKGVGKIKAIYIDGVEKEIPTDYDVSQLNDENNYAKITFDTAPGVGEIITCDYTYWYQDKKIEWLVKELLDFTGVIYDDYEVQNVVFDNLILVHQIWDTEAEFNACQTKQELEVLGEGSVRQVQTDWLETTTAHFDAGVTKDKIDTADNEIKLSDKSSAEVTGSVISSGYWDNPERVNNDNWNDYAGKTTDSGGEDIGVELSSTRWIKKIVIKHSGAGGGECHSKLQYYDGSWNDIAGTQTDYANDTPITDTYDNLDFLATKIRIYFWHSGVGTFSARAYELELWKQEWEEGHFRSQEKTLGGDSCLGIFNESHYSSGNCSYVFKVRSYDGSAWGDWLTVSNGQNISSLTPADKVQYDIVLNSTNGWTNPKVYDITTQYIDQGYSDTYCKLMTQNIDCGASLEAFGLFGKWYLLYGKELKFYTQSSPDGSTWEEEKEISENGQIKSTCISGTTRYLRGIVYFKTDNAEIRPLLQKIKLNWGTSKFEIILANFTNLTVKQAIEQLAKMPNYEIGFDATSKFFFRRKIADSNIDYILDDRNIKEFSDIDDGFGRVKNYIEANFGDYSKIMSVKLEEETRPDSIDKYGERRLIISGGNLLGADNVNIATGIAMRYYGFYSSNYSLTSLNYPNPKLRCRVKTKFIPQIDLSDTISLTFPIYKERKYAYLFDGFCFDDFVFGTSSLAFDGKLMKVIGMVLNLEEWDMELLLEEI